MDGIYLIAYKMHFASIFGSESYRWEARYQVDERKEKNVNLARAAYVCVPLPIPRLKGNLRISRCYLRARVRVARCPT